MATQVIMPVLGMAQETGKVVSWLKHPGEPVAAGEPLMEIETDKALMEIPAPVGGILGSILVPAGREVPVAEVVALILTPEEYRAQQAGRVAASPLAPRIAGETGTDLARVKPVGKPIEKVDVLAYLKNQTSSPVAPRRAPASPKARRLAAELGLDLVGLSGSGPEGAILAADVLRKTAEGNPSATPARSGSPVLAPDVGAVAVPATQNGQQQPLSANWRAMAEHMTRSWTTTPQFNLQRTVNAARLLAWHAEVAMHSTRRVTLSDLFVKIAAMALKQHPANNSAWVDGRIVRYAGIHIGIAVAFDDGLVVPVVHNADRLGLNEIAAARQELVERARAGRLRPADIQGGTFTISNLGMYGVDSFTAILNSPEAAILALGRIADRFVPVAGQPAVQPMLIVNLSLDHRVIDGARGARFLQTLADFIEEPQRLIK